MGPKKTLKTKRKMAKKCSSDSSKMREFLAVAGALFLCHF